MKGSTLASFSSRVGWWGYLKKTIIDIIIIIVSDASLVDLGSIIIINVEKFYSIALKTKKVNGLPNYFYFFTKVIL